MKKAEASNRTTTSSTKMETGKIITFNNVETA